MITQSILDILGLNSIYGYYEYIIDSKTNGQHTQSRQLFDELSEEQKSYFFQWFEEYYHYEAQDNIIDIDSELHELKQYFRK